jgi:uncharacterized protein YdeI (YjbR/CyaY-like superfamily)
LGTADLTGAPSWICCTFTPHPANMGNNADIYFTAGCGRCPLMATPQCKVVTWAAVLAQLRGIALNCGLTEELKWGHPVYTAQKSNIVMIGAFKDNCVLSFFKGALLADPNGLLALPGPNSQSARVIRFTGPSEIATLAPVLKAYIYEAIEVEKQGLKVAPKKNPEPVPAELQARLDENPALKAAFEALTPGRQRGYILYFSQPKQPQTRTARIDKCTPQILQGKGMHD